MVRFAVGHTEKTDRLIFDGRVPNEGELPFDRTIKISLTERLSKEQIQARMPHNLKTLGCLLDSNHKAFKTLLSKASSKQEKTDARLHFLRGRQKAVCLVEELSLRTRRILPLMKQMANFLLISVHLDYHLLYKELTLVY